VLASGQELTINYEGKRLTQVHADVWQGIMHLSRRAPEESLIRLAEKPAVSAKPLPTTSRTPPRVETEPSTVRIVMGKRAR